LKIYKKNLEEYINKYSKELSNEISLFTKEFNDQNNNLIKPKNTIIELNIIFKEEILHKLDKPSQLASLKNSFIFIIEPLINKIEEYFLELYKQAIDKKKFIETLRKSVKANFKEIDKKIKEYNKSLKEKENKDKEKELSEAAPLKEIDIKINDNNKKSVSSDVKNMFDDDDD
jgi:hypothetical protein